MTKTPAWFTPFFAVIMITFGSIGLFWSFLPSKSEQSESNLQVVRVPLSAVDNTSNGVMMTSYTIVIETPQTLKTGAGADLMFSLRRSNTPLPLTGTDQNIYDTHNIMLELRPELENGTITPGGSVSTAILEGQEINMIWQIQSDQSGSSDGTLWCYLVFYPLDETQEVQRTAFMIKPLSLTTRSFLGMNTRWTAVLAAASLTAAIILVIPQINQYLQNRSTSKRKQQHG